MRGDDIVDVLAAAVAQARDEASAPEVVRAYDFGTPPPANQFLVLLKPELFETAGPDTPRAVLDFVLGLLDGHGVVPRAAVVWPSAALRRERMLQRQYPTLAAAAERGIDALHPAAARLVADDARDHGGEVLGGKQLLARYADLTPFGLDVLTRACGIRKVAAGVYTTRMTIDGARYVVVNGFQPLQIEHYYAPGRVAVALEAWSETDFATLRRDVLGTVDPTQAPPGSLRRGVLDAAGDLGLSAISTRRNGVHISPSPVETMAQLAAYVMPGAADVTATSFARCLAAAGYDDDDVRHLATNPVVRGPRHAAPVNDLTEDLTWDAALGFVREHVPPAAAAATRSEQCAG